MNWEKVGIGEITNNLDNKRIPLNAKQRSEKEHNPIYPYIGANNIMGYIDEYIFDEKILCIAEDGGSWGYNETCAKIYNEKVWVNNHAHVLTAKDSLHLEYLKYYLNYSDLNLYINGATRGKLTKTSLNSIQIPLPPLETQKHIARILDHADELRQKNKAILKKYDELAQSLFLDMFGDPVTNPKGFEIVNIGDMIREAKYGTSSKAKEHGKYPYLRMNNITYAGHMDYLNLKYIDVTEAEKSKYIVKKDDVLFNRTNSKELVGKTGLILDDYEYIIAGYLIRLKCNKHCNPYYLWRHLNSYWAKKTLENMCKSIVGMANINAQELQKIKILKAPINLQNEFADRIEKIEAQKALAEKALAKSEDLFNALLQKAFKGELANSLL